MQTVRDYVVTGDMDRAIDKLAAMYKSWRDVYQFVKAHETLMDNRFYWQMKESSRIIKKELISMALDVSDPDFDLNRLVLTGINIQAFGQIYDAWNVEHLFLQAEHREGRMEKQAIPSEDKSLP